MLRFVIITTGTGALLYERVWVRSAHTDGKGNLLASLLTTMQEFSKQSTGLIVTYMEFGTGAITLVTDERTNLRCILFHDKEEGPEFARLISNQILRSFVELYSDAEGFSHNSLNTSKFNSFSSKIVEAMGHSAKTVLQQVKSIRGISNALLIYDDGVALSAGSADDELGIVANLQAMITFAGDIMLAKEDRPKVITLEMARQTVIVHRVANAASLVCLCRKNKDPAIYKSKVIGAVSLLEKVFLLTSNLQGYGR